MNAVINFHAPLKKLNKKTKTVSTKTMNHKRNSKCYSNKKCYNVVKYIQPKTYTFKKMKTRKATWE